MMMERFQLSKRVVLWLALIGLTAFMLYLEDSRYNNIDNTGTDYYLVESRHTCRLNQICSAGNYSEGVKWTVKISKRKDELEYVLTFNKILSAKRIVFRHVDNNMNKIEKGVVSSEIKGQNLRQVKQNQWQLSNIKFNSGIGNGRYILYVFTSNAIYELRQVISF